MSRARHRAPTRRWWLVGVGVVLVVAGGAVAYRIAYFLHHSSASAHALVRAFEAGRVVSPLSRARRGGAAAAACPSAHASGRARMLVDIPALHEIAPVLEGTSDATLGVAVGHLATSPWPGAGGNTVLDAHDVTFFRSIDLLRPGDAILLVGPCSTWHYEVSRSAILDQARIVATGAGSHVVLVTCWPTDALFYTTRRFVLVARLSTVTPTLAGPPARPSLPAVAAALPPELVSLHLDATTAGIPLGTLVLRGSYRPSWLSSSRPLQASDAATHLLEGAIVVARTRDARAWAVIAPGAPFASIEPLAGPITWTSPVQVTIVGNGVRVAGAVLGATVDLGGVVRELAVTTDVRSGRMVIARVELSPA